ncbi:MAG: hypothetical protein KatS3mg008_0825 [Acidimicrobiales bacterium]|nr:MAG: hypothetical protein KatS3mg008_0825 [Acidimicrobiales bacterium]
MLWAMRAMHAGSHLSAAPGLVIAHQGGWDEALFVAVPLLIVFMLLVASKKRLGGGDSER